MAELRENKLRGDLWSIVCDFYLHTECEEHDYKLEYLKEHPNAGAIPMTQVFNPMVDKAVVDILNLIKEKGYLSPEECAKCKVQLYKDYTASLKDEIAEAKKEVVEEIFGEIARIGISSNDINIKSYIMGILEQLKSRYLCKSNKGGEMNKQELAETIKEHKKWLLGEGGLRADLYGANLSRADLSRADLSGADLSGADLSGADLSRADLSRADLSRANLYGADLSGADLSRANLFGADLSGADLSRADLSGANLSGADLKDTILADINWLAYIGIVPDKRGIAYAYKITKAIGEGIFNGGINYTKGKTFEVEVVDVDTNQQCSYGINLATFAWCLNNFTDKTYRLFMFRFNVKDAVCPIGSDGKFRVKKCIKVGECDWKGDLLPVGKSNKEEN